MNTKTHLLRLTFLTCALLFAGSATVGCRSALLVDSISPEELAKGSYETVRELKAKCTRLSCREVTAEECIRKLRARAARLNADFVIIDSEDYVGAGHAGASAVRWVCKGRAVRSKRLRAGE